MKPPIIVSDPGDISIFRSAEEAERYLELPDVKDGQTIVYDSEGRRLSLEVLSEPDSKFLGITISGAERVATGREESSTISGDKLRQLLIDILIKIWRCPSIISPCNA